MVKISVYIPANHLEPVKLAMFDAGAGKIGNYEHCCWQTLGKGQFKPLEGSNPYLGNLETLEVVEEYLVEMVCEKAIVKRALLAMKSAHPYEEPAFGVFEMSDIDL